MIGRYQAARRETVVLAATCLILSATASAIAASMGVLLVLLVVGLVIAALAVAMVRPNYLFYAYCAAIPFNFALPPGPAGTVARIAGLVFVAGYLIRAPGSLRPGTVPAAGWLFVSWCLVSILWAINADLAFLTWLSLAQLFLVTVLVASLVAADESIVRGALWSYAISATLTAAIAIVAYLQGMSMFSRATAFADQDPALFSSLVLPAAVILMGEVQARSTRPPFRFFAFAALVLCVGALALSGTRSAWAGLLAAALGWVILRRDRRQILAVAALALGVVLVVVTVPGVGDFLTGRVGSSLSTGGSGRTDIWAVGLSILAAAPLFGVGFGNFGQAFTPYAIAHASASGSSGALFADRAAHNVLLGATVETGLVGGLLLALFVGAALLAVKGDQVGTVVRLALISLVVQSAFLDIISQKQVWLFLALALGLGAARTIERRSHIERPPTDGRGGISRQPTT